MNRKLPLLIPCLLLGLRVIAQTPVFTADGKLQSFKCNFTETKHETIWILKYSHKVPVQTNTLQTFDVTTLKDDDKKLKSAARQVLLKKINQTLQILTDDPAKNSLTVFYSNLWDDPNELTGVKNYLTELKTYLTDENTVPNLPLAAKILRPIQDNLLTASTTVFSIKPTPLTQQIQLIQKVPFNQFTVDYYNNTLPPVLTFNMNLESYNASLQYFGDQKRRIESILQDYRNQTVFDDDVYSRMKALDDDLNNINSIFYKTRQMLKNDWFKTWFWFRGGEIRLNPLDFTTDEYLTKSPKWDIDKAQIFNTYIDTMINRRIRLDTTANVDQFIKLLSYKNQGKDVFSLQQRLDSLNKVNDSIKTQLLTTTTILNSITIPKTGVFYNYSATSDVLFYNAQDKTDKKFLASLSDPARTYENRTLVLHNIKGSLTAGILETNKSIPDRSAAENITDTLASQIGQFAALVSQYTPYASIINTLIPTAIPSNTAITVSNAPAGSHSFNMRTQQLVQWSYIQPSDIDTADATSAYAAVPVNQYLRQYLIDQKIYVAVVFNTVPMDPALAAKRDLMSSLHPVNAADQQTIDKINAFLDSYKKALMDYTFAKLAKDSSQVAYFLTIYNNSTLPVTDILTPQDGKSPVYYSKILQTSTSDSAVSKKVLLYVYSKKDTVKIDSFTYRVGKNYRFQLSGGLAYTLTPFSQVQAQQANGQITVTSDVQQYRLLVGLHIYLGKGGLFLQDNRFAGRFSERISLFTGVGIPNPLENIYVGLGYDLWPGFKITGGAHFIRADKYTVENNVITDQRLHYAAAGPFLALQIDPLSLINALNIFKKQ